ncbi:cutinase, partial [Rhizodiscina lignyota]
AVAAGVAALPLEPRQVTCVSGVYIISARGSNEDPGEGKMAQVSTLIKNAVPGSTSVAVDYPAAIISDDSIYPESVTDGINDTIDKITAYVGACGSSSRIVLLGYSQGGNVMTDVLAGGVDKPAPLSSTYKSNIVGVAVFGDPTFTVGQSFDAGSSTSSGIFARSSDGASLALLNTYASVIQSYCDSGDPFCADGDDDTVHSNEVPNHAQAASDFIASLV